MEVPVHQHWHVAAGPPNRLVRQFLPKGLDLRRLSPRQVAPVERLLNNRPRKCLGYRTPREVMQRL